MPLACFQCADKLQFAPKHAKGMSLRYGVIVLENLMRLFTNKSFYYQGFFAVKRREGFYPWGKVEGCFFLFLVTPLDYQMLGHEKSVEVHPLRTSTPTKPCNSVILVIFFSTVRAPCNC